MGLLDKVFYIESKMNFDGPKGMAIAMRVGDEFPSMLLDVREDDPTCPIYQNQDGSWSYFDEDGYPKQVFRKEDFWFAGCYGSTWPKFGVIKKDSELYHNVNVLSTAGSAVIASLALIDR